MQKMPQKVYAKQQHPRILPELPGEKGKSSNWANEK
jgi:hypothetical protein